MAEFGIGNVFSSLGQEFVSSWDDSKKEQG
jgi:hypothetical protein